MLVENGRIRIQDVLRGTWRNTARRFGVRGDVIRSIFELDQRGLFLSVLGSIATVSQVLPFLSRV